MPRCIDWRDDAVLLLDQTVLPHQERWLRIDTVDGLVDAIARLAVRGAPALGVAGAFGVALAAREVGRAGPAGAVEAAARRVAEARPTAVNLSWGVDRALARLGAGAEAVLAEARAVLAEEVSRCRAVGERGADLLLDLLATRPGSAGDDPGERLRILTHCNTGWLACVEWGTALGVVRVLHERGRLARVYADETRPLLQGARLTGYELAGMGVDYRIVVDSAGPTVLANRMVDAVLVGADRVAANGDVVNKIGTYPLALAAGRAGVPFVVAAPESTVDAGTATGADVPIEDRDPAEVLSFAGTATAPDGAGAYNPAFDVTPADLVTAIVTDLRVIRPAPAATGVAP
ncbi:MAG TPA: S-methyl-5-thioribose-1-phosphate isomerase [Mycobacteriales bacterium]|nr:S-methyl-5-thioribose-1-phosphate isomerase [Mycobacteriales bacterium]